MTSTNNMQVVYSGMGYVKTIEYIVSQSSIIQAYRTSIENTEEDYHIPEKTLHHTSLDIESRLVAMMNDIHNLHPHKCEKGCSSPAIIEDHYQKGWGMFQCGLMCGSIHSSVSELTDDTNKIDTADLSA